MHLNLLWFFNPLKPSKPSRLSKAKKVTSTIIIATSSQPKIDSTNAQKPTCGNCRRRSSYGSPRRSPLKKTFTQKQFTFTAPVSSNPHVGIIGEGMAVLARALRLDKRGVKPTVFDLVAFSFVLLCFWCGLCLYLMRVYAYLMLIEKNWFKTV